MNQRIPERADVVVIGGGPAGSMAAGLLAQKGFDVVLLEKAKHPRMVVGESFLPHFWRFTDMLGNATQKIQAANFVKKAGGIVKWDDSFLRTRFREFGHTRSPLHVDREIFDKILLDTSREQGAKVFEETPARRVDVSGEEKIVHYRDAGGADGQIRAPFVVDASGQAALIAHQLGFRVFDEELRFSAVWGYFESARYLDFDGNVHPFEERFDASPVTFVEAVGGWGWAWKILLKQSVSVGFVVPSERLKAGGESLDERFHALVASTPFVAKFLAGARFIPESVRAIRNYAYKPMRLAVNNCYLVGDAAAFVDPINSAGVTFGMYAAVLAAWSIERAMKNHTRREQCQQMFEDQYRQRLQIFRLIALPTNREFSAQEAAELVRAFRQFSDAEKQLALTTTVLTHRSEKVRHLLKLVGVEDKAIYGRVEIPAELR